MLTFLVANHCSGHYKMFRAKKIKSDSEKCPKTLTPKNGRVQNSKKNFCWKSLFCPFYDVSSKKTKKSDSESPKTLTQKNGRVQKH